MTVRVISTSSNNIPSSQSCSGNPSLLGLQRAFMALLDAPEIRRTKVARLHLAVRDEEYQVEPSLVADAMIREMDW